MKVGVKDMCTANYIHPRRVIGNAIIGLNFRTTEAEVDAAIDALITVEPVRIHLAKCLVLLAILSQVFKGIRRSPAASIYAIESYGARG